ncbi:hypothetical protein A9Q95_08965 [Rhodobacterales bacterium 59_46_T64]|nr:hypothetical protein A9Q95_08965 [Rhodobacterales bacterium 59_46_T64]
MWRRLVSEGFRVFFLGAGVVALVSMALWLAYLGGLFPALDALPMPVQHWHGHELIFGYGGAALGGFFLTAVPNWTGAKAAPHRFIAMVAGVWLLGRLMILASGVVPPVMVGLVDLAFAPILAAKIATQLLRRPKPQNMVFLLFLILFWLANLRVHLDWMGMAWGDAGDGLRAGLMALAGMIAILGGRVTPAFTRNALHRAGIESSRPRDPKFFTPLIIVLAALLAASALVLPGTVFAAAIALCAGAVMLLRVVLWATWFQWGQPILWALHLSYGSVGFGLILTGAARIDLLPEIAALHFLAIGGVGGMTVAVMSRATLGHTGRPLEAPRGVVLAYWALPLAALLRWGAGQVTGDLSMLGLYGAGALWCAAYAGFLVCLWPAFWHPRLPRAPVGRAPPA